MRQKTFRSFSRAAMMLLTFMMAFTAQTAWAQTRYSVSYINADGNSATCEKANAVSIYMEGLDQFSSPFHWLVVDNDITLNGASNSSTYDSELILGDGKTLTINGQMKFSYGSLNIYAQSGGTGMLVVSGNCENQGAFQVPNGKTLTINGGTVELTNTNSNGFALRGNLVMNGGNLTAGGSGDGISGNTTINWKNSTDRIKAKNYGGTVTIADGKYVKDANGKVYCGTLTNMQKSAIANVELQPATEAEFITYACAHYHTLNLPDGVTASGTHYTYNNVDYYAPGTTVTLSGGTTPAGYAVSGYTVDGTPIVGTSFAISTNAIVTIVTAPIEYSITYHENGGTMPNAYTTTYNIESADITLPTPTRDGYTFGGWYVNDGLTGDAVTAITTGAYGAKNFWAKWTAHTYAVAFDKNHNDATGTMDNQDFTYDEAAKALTANAFERTGYTFSGWNTETDGSGNAYTNQQKVQNLTTEQGATVTLYAQWTPTSYSITYHVNDGTMPGTYPTTYNIESADITLPTPTRDGYTFGGWYVNDGLTGDAVTTITTGAYGVKNFWAKWTAHTYTVTFDKNGGSGDAMDNQDFTYDVYQYLTANTYTAPTNYAFGGWNTKADGSGISFDDEEWAGNLTTENGATVTLYAQWGKDINVWCTASVPDQTKDGYTAMNYKFEAANSGTATTNTVVKEGDKVLTLGTDYRFGDVVMANGDPIDWQGSKVGDECKVEINGIGDYAGTVTAYFKVISPSANGTWGDLTWNIDSDGNFTITGSGAMNTTTQGNYGWYSKASGIRTITIGEGITTVAADAFAGTSNFNVYSNVTSLTLPSSLTTIGEDAFAYCTGLSINLADLTGIDYPASAFSYINTITGTLYDNADNSKIVAMMSHAGSNNVTISGHTFYKDNDWNTICLPFNVKEYNSLLDGATIRELDLTGYYSKEGVYYSYYSPDLRRTGFDESDGTLYLYFKEPTADENDNLLVAGKPYLIKWPSGENITSDLTFNDVEVVSSPLTVESTDEKVHFWGTFSHLSWDTEVKSILFVGTGNNLYWPQSGASLGACRAYFQLSNGASAREIRMNFGEEETTGIVEMRNEKGEMRNVNEEMRNDAWYDMSGRKVNSQFTIHNSQLKKGVYIHNGKKVVIK